MPRTAKKTAAQKKPTKKSSGPIEIAGVRITNPGRVLYEDQAITKTDLADYYVKVADWILPHLADRPISIVRCPTGMSGECFYQKHPPTGMSDAVDRVAIRERRGTDTYLVVRDLPGLITLVQFGALEIHVWGSKAEDVERPDRLVFDLDPDPELPWSHVVAAAELMREALKQAGLESFVKTTGGKGLHVVAPIERRQTWPEVKQFCKAVADLIVGAAPNRYLSNMSKAARRGKIFIDYLRNDRGSTSIVAYSSRARSGAPVSAPLDWKDLRKLDGPQAFDVQNMPQRLARMKRDPWRDIYTIRQSITAAAKKKVGLR